MRGLSYLHSLMSLCHYSKIIRGKKPRNQGFMAYLIDLSAINNKSFAKSITNNQSGQRGERVRSVREAVCERGRVRESPICEINRQIGLSHTDHMKSIDQ